MEFCNSRGDILGFFGRIFNNLKYKSNPALRQPVQNLVSEINPPKFPKTKTILEDIRANYELNWNTTYSENEVGTDFIKRVRMVRSNRPKCPFLHERYANNDRLLGSESGVSNALA